MKEKEQPENSFLIHLKSQGEKYLTPKEVTKIFKAFNIDVQQTLEIKSSQIVNSKEFTAKVHAKIRNEDGTIEDSHVLISFRLGPPTWDQFIRTTYRSGSNVGIRIIIHEGNVSCIGELVDNNNACGLKTYLIEANGLIQCIFEGKAQQIIYSYETGPIVTNSPAEPLPSMRQVQESEFWTCYYLPAWGEPPDKPIGLYGNRDQWAKIFEDLSLPMMWNDDGLHITLSGDPDSYLIKPIWEHELEKLRQEYPDAKIELLKDSGIPYGISIRILELPMSSLIKMGPRKKTEYGKFVHDAEHNFLHFIDDILVDLRDMK